MKILTPAALLDFLTNVASDYDLRLPVVSVSGSRVLGSLEEGVPALSGGRLTAKPTAIFFPHADEMFTFGVEGVLTSPSPGRPLLVIGFTPRDLLCLRFIDRFFAEGLRDDIYFRRREGAVIAAVSGFCGPGGLFIPLSGGEGDLEFVFDGADWLVVAYSPAGERVAAAITTEAPLDALAAIKAESISFVAADVATITAASELLLADMVPDSFWEEVAAACILCTGCNLVCPTCTCFGVQDWRYAQGVERSRMWDSCQLDGFMREAGGHNPLGTEALRTRRRIHHKLAADRTKWGEISCFLCGRCDAVCPTGIGIVAVSRRMVATYGSP